VSNSHLAQGFLTAVNEHVERRWRVGEPVEFDAAPRANLTVIHVLWNTTPAMECCRADSMELGELAAHISDTMCSGKIRARNVSLVFCSSLLSVQ